jgi:farnesyl-diphosphate farnesyltransferase
VLRGAEPAGQLAADLEPKLAQGTLPAERELILNSERVVRLTWTLEPAQRAAIERCVAVMCDGMHQFQQTASLAGVARMRDLDDYCYYVAGVVGEMLTQLFCSYALEIARQRPELERLSVSFAQGLQMTNILKDVWEDRSRGACWLPQEVFTPHQVDLARLVPGTPNPGFDAGMRDLIGVAHAHLRDALDYTLFIPGPETGIRRFCLWAIGLAVLTLQKIYKNPGFTAGSQVKISRRSVSMTRFLADLAVRNDWMLRRLFAQAARGLPLARIPEVSRPQPDRTQPVAGMFESLDELVAPGSEPARRRSFGSPGT